MKILTQAFASSAESDEVSGFRAPAYALVDLGSEEFRRNLLTLRELATTVAQSQPTISVKSEESWLNYMVFEAGEASAEFFDDEDGTVEPLLAGQDFCLVADEFAVPQTEGDCASIGGNGPVQVCTETTLMVFTGGFWFNSSIEYFSAKLLTAVIPWPVLENTAPTAP